jgi:hypothetical protein
MSSSKKFTCKETLRQAFICLKPRERHWDTCIRVQYTQYTYSHRDGEGGGSSTREKVRGTTVHKAGLKIPFMTICISSL